MTELPPAGWYPDPENAKTTRYWDGNQWAPKPVRDPNAPWVPKGQRKWFYIGLAGLIAVIGFAIAGYDDDDDTSSSSVTDSGLRTVVYNVAGTAESVDITYKTATGTSQQSGVAVPLESKSGSPGLTLTFSSGDFVYISAQNNGGGTVVCTIEVDGIRISTNRASGEYQIATCNGSAF